MEIRKKFIFIVVAAIVIVIALILSTSNDPSNLSQKEKVSTTNKINHPTSTNDIEQLTDKDYEELINNFIVALSFIDKDPNVLDEFVEKYSSYKQSLLSQKKYIGKSVDSIFIESVNIKNSIHSIKVKLTISGNIQTKIFKVKKINGKFKFVESEK
jgi:hypothetical protein